MKERIDVLWMPEKCDEKLVSRPCCGSLLRSTIAVRHSSSDLLVDSLCDHDTNSSSTDLMRDTDLILICEESGEESRHQRLLANDCTVAVSIMIDEMEDPADGNGEILYMLCGCYMKTVTGTDMTAVTVTVYGYTHVSDMVLHSARHKQITRGNVSQYAHNTIEPANRIPEILEQFQVPIYAALRRIDQATRKRKGATTLPHDSNNDIDDDVDADVDTGVASDTGSGGADADADDEGIDYEDPEPVVDPVPTTVFDTESIQQNMIDAEEFHEWLYIPGGYAPQLGEHETTPVINSFQERAKILLQTIVELWIGNESALTTLHKRGIRYYTVSTMQMDRTIMTYLAMAVCHQPDWSELFITGISRICEHMFERVHSAYTRETIMDINGISMEAVDIRSVQTSHGESVRLIARRGLTQLVQMWRNAMGVDIEAMCATRWPEHIPKVVEQFISTVWDCLGE